MRWLVDTRRGVARRVIAGTGLRGFAVDGRRVGVAEGEELGGSGNASGVVVGSSLGMNRLGRWVGSRRPSSMPVTLAAPSATRLPTPPLTRATANSAAKPLTTCSGQRSYS